MLFALLPLSTTWPRAAGVTLALLLAACRCGEPVPERAWEVGAPLRDVPAAASDALAELIPAGAPLFVYVERPAEVVRLIRSDPRLARALDPRVLADLALSDVGATARAVRQRFNDLSRLPISGTGAEALLDGPLALAARVGPSGTDVLLAKRLSPQAKASWELAQMLQSVAPSLREVRVERYRGFPLRKVLVDDRRRISYFVLRNLLVAGTSDAWVKDALDLALGAAAPRAAGQPAIRLALSETRGLPLVAVVDADALRSEPGRPGLPTAALAETAWLRIALRPGAGLLVSLAPWSARPLVPAAHRSLAHFAPKGTLVALARGIDVGDAVKQMLSSAHPGGARAEAALALRDALLRDLVPTLGSELFWYTDGLDVEGDRIVVRHVVGASLRHPQQAAAALPVLASSLLEKPIEIEREGTREITCGGGALCYGLADDVLLFSNRASALRAALAVADGRAPGLGIRSASETSDLFFIDGVAVSAALGRAALAEGGPQADPREVAVHTEPLLAWVRGLGPLLVALKPAGMGRLGGEVRTP